MNAHHSRDRIPAFGVARIMALGAMLYLLFTAFFSFFFVLSDEVGQELTNSGSVVIDLAAPPEWNAARLAQAGGAPAQGRDILRGLSINLLALAAGIAAAALYHAPLRRSFRALRRGRAIDAATLAQAKKRIWRSPGALALATGLPLALTSALRLGIRHDPRELALLPIEASFLALSVLFIFLWQRHRVQSVFTQALFSDEELSGTIPGGHRIRVRGSLTQMIILATLLPAVVVALFLASGVSFVGSFSSLTPDQRSLLFGAADSGLTELSVLGMQHEERAGLRLDDMPIPIIGPLDTVRVVAGLSIGLSFIIVYVLLIAHWMGLDIVRPIEKLRANIDRAKTGDLSALTPATTANEVGELTVGINEMLRGIAERGRIKELFGQYLTKEISEAILDGRVQLSGARYDATVMFTDIRGFTAMSERMAPAEVFAFLNDYLGRMIEVIVARGGIIDKFLGDGLLVVFGLPIQTESHAEDAFGAALDMRSALAKLNAERLAAGREPIEIGIGMHSGELIAGNVGSDKKLQFTVIGDTVNLASRIEGLNKEFGSYLLLSGDTWTRLCPASRQGRFERLEKASIRGKAAKVDLYKFLESAADPRAQAESGEGGLG